MSSEVCQFAPTGDEGQSCWGDVREACRYQFQDHPDVVTYSCEGHRNLLDDGFYREQNPQNPLASVGLKDTYDVGLIQPGDEDFFLPSKQDPIDTDDRDLELVLAFTAPDDKSIPELWSPGQLTRGTVVPGAKLPPRVLTTGTKTRLVMSGEDNVDLPEVLKDYL